MNILYLSPVHPLLTPGDPLPKWQTQMSHVRALEQLSHSVKVIAYTPKTHIRVSLVERVFYNIKLLFYVSFIGEICSFTVTTHLKTRSGWPYDGNRFTRKFVNFTRRSKHLPIGAIFLSLGADVLFPMTIRLLKWRLRVPLVILSGVSPIRDGNPRERVMAKYVGLVATNDPSHAQEWKELGARKAIVLPISAIDPELHYSRDIKRDIDVLFVGTVTPEREQFFQKFHKLLSPHTSFVVKHHVFEEDYVKLLSRAKIVLNPLRPEMKRGANLRLFEIPACGALQLASHTNPEWFTEGKEILTYDDAEDAARLVNYYLSHKGERERIAKRGQERTLGEHTFQKRFKKLIIILSSRT